MKNFISLLNTKENHRFIIGMLAGITLLALALALISSVKKSQEFNPILWNAVTMLIPAFIIVYVSMRWIAIKTKHQGVNKPHNQKSLYPFLPNLSDVQQPCLGFEETMLRTQPYFLKPWRLDQVKTTLIEGFKPWGSLQSEPAYFQAMFLLLIAAKYRDRHLIQDYSYLAKSFSYVFGNSELTEETKVLMINGYIASMQDQSGIDLEKETANYNSSYFYSQTLLMGLLRDARQKGVLSTSEFSWLKRTDRKLYMALSSVGRYRALPEALGMVAHWKWETSQRYACKDINVNLAIQGLKLELTKESWNKEDWPLLFGEEYLKEESKVQEADVKNKFSDTSTSYMLETELEAMAIKKKNLDLNKQEWKQLVDRLQRLEEEVEFLRGNQ